MRLRTLWKLKARRAKMLIYVDQYGTPEIIRVGHIQVSDYLRTLNEDKLFKARKWLACK